MSDSMWNDPRITAYVLGELPAAEETRFERELDKNPPLAAAVDEARQLTGQLQQCFAAEAMPPLDDQHRQAILSAEAESATRSRSWRLALVGLATAATLLLIVSVSLWRTPIRSAGRIESAVADRPPQPSVQPSVELFEAPSSDRSELLRQEPRPPEPGVPQARVPQARVPEAGAQQARAREAVVPDSSGRMEIAGPWQRDSGPESVPKLAEGVAAEVETAALAPAAATGEDAAFSAPGRAAAGGSKSGWARAGRGPTQPTAARVEAPTPIDRGSAGGGFGGADDQGRGPGSAGDRFDPIVDNPFRRVSEHPLSTFSVDVDTASYSKVRDFVLRADRLPRPDAVRIEELLNYFDYGYPPPAADAEHPFTAHTAITSCPWQQGHRLARIALKGKELQPTERPPCNLVFLLDTSGSMNAPQKLPLVIDGMKMLLKQLNDQDRVAIAVYAGSAGLVLDSTPAGEQTKIRRALTRLAAGGSTNGGAGIQLAYQTARDHFLEDGVNRVILCTDGDFNVGVTGTDALGRMIEQQAQGGIFLTVLGFGMGNHNDAMLEQISGRGNGHYALIDSRREARKVLVEQTAGTLVTIAKDVKLQIEFNPAQVSAYRLIGYENRLLAKEDFNDDERDAGEIGAGHEVTALYELVPAGLEADGTRPPVDPLRYQHGLGPREAADSGELMTVKLRYQQPDGDTSTLIEFPVTDNGSEFAEAPDDLRFAAAVAGFGMQLRRSPHRGTWTLSEVGSVAHGARGEDRLGLRSEFVQLVRRAGELMGQEE